jgi:hypothetical protein
MIQIIAPLYAIFLFSSLMMLKIMTDVDNILFATVASDLISHLIILGYMYYSPNPFQSWALWPVYITAAIVQVASLGGAIVVTVKQPKFFWIQAIRFVYVAFLITYAITAFL